MKVSILDQPLGNKTGDRLETLLRDAASGQYNQVTFVSAFAKRAGVTRLQPALKVLKASASTFTCIVGVDHNGTSSEAVNDLASLSDRLFIFHSTRPEVTFHPKAYLFEGSTAASLIIGSQNFTAGGLYTNIELGVEIQFDLPVDNKQLTDMTTWLNPLLDTSMPFIEEVTAKNLATITACLPNEAFIAAIFRTTSGSSSLAPSTHKLNSIFGPGNFPSAPTVTGHKPGMAALTPSLPAHLPTTPQIPSTTSGVTQSAAAPAIIIPHSHKGQTIWFETRSMTGGSRNILDLSKKSLINKGNPAGTLFDIGDPQFMRGSVAFFGLDPTKTQNTKDVIIHFSGVDYSGNTILFPAGPKANGTWRLQIKGVSAAGEAITDDFSKNHNKNYLMQKIITFTKANPDYYFMSVYPGTDLPKFKALSNIIARNGSTNSARQLGLI
jgi:HKD family nuclease